MKRVIVTGSLGYDYIMDFPGRFADRIMPDKIHVLSLSFLVDKMTKNVGACATNLAYTFKLLGGDPLIVSSAGKDFHDAKQFFIKHKISIKGIHVFHDDYCCSYHVVTDQDDNQIGAFHMGAQKHNKELSLLAMKGLAFQKKARPLENFVTIGPTDPVAMSKYVDECHELKLSYLYDPAFQIADFTPEELRKGLSGAAIAIGNDYEIALMEKRLGISHEKIVALVPILITTLGPKGSVIESGKDAMHIQPAKITKVVDPTGAGDAYRAGFLAGYLGVSRGDLAKARPPLIKIQDLVICGQMGSVAAAYAIEHYGTVAHHFTKKEFEKRYSYNYRNTITFN